MMTKHLHLLLALLLALSFTPLHAEEGDGKGVPNKAIYHAVGDRFVVNIKEGQRNRFMQVKVQVMTRQQSVAEAVEGNMPALSHAMIMLLAHQDGATMRNIQSREQVRAQALSELQKVLAEVAGLNEGLEAVYFTDFVIQ